MKVWLVGVSDCESNSVIAICSTKEIAERELFKERDRLIKEYKDMHIHQQEFNDKYCKENNIPKINDPMYKDMIEALSGNDYEHWDNYPHDKPYLTEIEVKEV